MHNVKPLQECNPPPKERVEQTSKDSKRFAIFSPTFEKRGGETLSVGGEEGRGI